LGDGSHGSQQIHSTSEAGLLPFWQMVTENAVYLPNSNLVGGAITILKNDGVRQWEELSHI